MTTVSIEIDGNKVEARSDAMLIEAADEAGFNIPRFCYHKKLSIAANCRMCLVEVEKAAKPLPACATPVTEGMKVFTRSPKAIRAQKNVMEFLLINHPLDCPICDQGGECELQDVALGYGKDVSRFTESKRVVANKNIGPLIATDMTRCIHCTRCVRFGEEITGVRQLGATGRGEHMEIGTYIEATVDTEMSANIIDLCPVGALTSKPFRYSSRAWEMTQHASVAPHDCIGSNIFIHVRRNRIMRVVPRDNESINETWISDRDRFSYDALYSVDRITSPMLKVDGHWQVTDWNTALDNVAIGFKALSVKAPNSIGCLVSPSSTVEELYLAQKLMRGMGSNNIDHRLLQTDFSDQSNAAAYPALGVALKDIPSLDSILLIASNVRKDQPIAAHRIRMAALQGAQIFAVNPADYGFAFPLAVNEIADIDSMLFSLAGIAKALLALTNAAPHIGFSGLINDVVISPSHQKIAEGLVNSGKAAVIVGNLGNHHPRAAAIHALAVLISDLANASYGVLSHGANSAGAWLAGAVPHRIEAGQDTKSIGLDARQMSESALSGYLLINIDPEIDSANADALVNNLGNAEFVVALSAYKNDAIHAVANVILPMASFGETSGTLVNAEGVWQSFNGAVTPYGEARPAWKVLRVLGNVLDLAGFDYISSDEISTELKCKVDAMKISNSGWKCPETLTVEGSEAALCTNLGIYSVDPIVRRSVSLQSTNDGRSATLKSALNDSNLGVNNENTTEQVETV